MITINVQSFPAHFHPDHGGQTEARYIPKQSSVIIYTDETNRPHLVKHIRIVSKIKGNQATKITLECHCCQQPLLEQKLSQMSFKVGVYMDFEKLVMVPDRYFS